MPTSDKQCITTAERLARLGLADREKYLPNIQIPSGSHVRITHEHPIMCKYIAPIEVKTPEHLKQLLGIPNNAIPQASPAPAGPKGFVPRTAGYPFLPTPALHLSIPDVEAGLVSYLLRDTKDARGPELKRLNLLFANTSIFVSVVLLADVYVFAGSELVIDDKIQTLFARYVYVEDGGSIVMSSPLAGIDVAGIKRGLPKHPPPPDSIVLTTH